MPSSGRDSKAIRSTISRIRTMPATAVLVEDGFRPGGVPQVDPLPLVEDPDVADPAGELDLDVVVIVVAAGMLDDIGAGLRKGQRDVSLTVLRHAQTAHGVAADGADQRHRDDVPG